MGCRIYGVIKKANADSKDGEIKIIQYSVYQNNVLPVIGLAVWDQDKLEEIEKEEEMYAVRIEGEFK